MCREGRNYSYHFLQPWLRQISSELWFRVGRKRQSEKYPQKH